MWRNRRYRHILLRWHVLRRLRIRRCAPLLLHLWHQLHRDGTRHHPRPLLTHQIVNHIQGLVTQTSLA